MRRLALKSMAKATADTGNNAEDRKKASYYKKDIAPWVDPETKAAFQNYINLSDGEFETHLHVMREKAWAAAPYPCIGMWSFLRPGLPRHPKYGIIEKNAREAQPGSYLICDVGAGLGQELRTLAIGGVCSENLRATDLRDTLWQCGLDLFRDRDRMQGALFVPADILEAEKEPLAAWFETMDVVIAGNFLHCFDWDRQIIALKNIVRLLKDQQGSMVVAWQLGGSGTHVTGTTQAFKRFHHTERTFRDMLKRVDSEIETKWEIETHETPMPKGFLKDQSSWMSGDTTILAFSLVRK